jgi:hypothetical protein
VTRTLNRLGDRLLRAFLPEAEAQADGCTYSSLYNNCYHKKVCSYGNGQVCSVYHRSGSCGSWYYYSSC